MSLKFCYFFEDWFRAKYNRATCSADFYSCTGWFFLSSFFKKADKLNCSLLEVILMAKIKEVSPPFQVKPVLPGGNTLLTDIGHELDCELSRYLQHECYTVKLISSKVVMI